MADSLDRVLQFVNPLDFDEVRYDFNDGDNTEVGEGLDLGSPGLRKVTLEGGSVDGGERVQDARTNPIGFIPLIIKPQESLASVDIIYQALITELERKSNDLTPDNCLKWQPIDAPAAFYLFTYRSEVLPSLYRGQIRQPDCILFDGYVPVLLERFVWMDDGAGNPVHT